MSTMRRFGNRRGLSAFVIALGFAGCASGSGNGGPSSVRAIDVPSWFLTPAQFTEMPHGVGTAYSRDMGIARQQAVALARVDLAQQIETRLESLIETSVGQAGGVNPRVSQFFNQAAREVLQTRLMGVRTAEASVVREAIGYRFFVLVIQDVEAANRALLDQMKADEALYAEFEKTEAFDRLNAEIQRLEAARRPPGDDL